MARLAIFAFALCCGLVAAVAGGSRPAAAQGLNYFYCFAPSPEAGVTFVSSVQHVGPVAERSRYGQEFVAYLKSKGIRVGTTGYCTMRGTMREIDRGRTEMTQATCPECTGAEKLQDIDWARGGPAIQAVLVGKPMVSDSVSVAQAGIASDTARDKLVLSASDAAEVLEFFFGSLPHQIDENDRRFAQAVILQSARSSTQMGYVESIFKSAISPTATPSKVLKAIARRALKDLAEPDTVQAAFEGENSGAVVFQIRRQWKSVWADRIELDDSSMLPKSF